MTKILMIYEDVSLENNINILKNIKLGTVPESVIILREQFLCRSCEGGR